MPRTVAGRGTTVDRHDGSGTSLRRSVALQRAIPRAVVHVDLPHLDLVLAGVADDLGGGVEAHGLAVDKRGGEGRGLVALEPAGDVDEDGEARGVALGEAVLAEALDLLEAALGEVPRVAALEHAGDEPLAEGVDRVALALPRGHGAAELVGLVVGEARGDDRELHGLLLEERHAERAPEHLLDLGVGVGDRVGAVAPAEVGVDHPALDRPGADNRDLDDQVVEAPGLEAGEHGHLRPRLDLEDAEGVGVLDHVVDGGVLAVLGEDTRDAQALAAVALDELERLADAREHAQAEDIDLEHAHGVDVVLVPLDDGAVLHRGVLDGDEVAERRVGDDEAADVLGEVAGEADELGGEPEHEADGGVGGVETGFTHALGVGRAAPVVHVLGEGVHAVEAEAHRLADVAHGAAGAVGDDLGGERGPLAPVGFVDVLDHLLAALVLEVDVDVGRLPALAADEAGEEQAEAGGVHLGDAQAVADGGIGRPAPPLAEDAARAGEIDDAVTGEEVGLVAQLGDEGELVLDLVEDLVGQAGGVALGGPAVGEVAEVLGDAEPGRAFEGVLVAELVEAEGRGSGRDLGGAGGGPGVVGEEAGYLVGGL